MKEKRLLNVLSEIDERFVEEAAPVDKAGRASKRLHLIRWGTAAACLCLLCASALTIPNIFRRELPPDDGFTAIPDVTVLIHADYPVYDTAQELVESADLVFSGSIENVTYETLDVRTESGTDSLAGLSETQGIPYTLYEIKVIKVYKGNVEGDTIIVKRPGGEAGGSMYILDGASVILQGETYLFLTETYENNYPSLLNAIQASYDMNTPEGIDEENSGAITLSQILEVLEQ